MLRDLLWPKPGVKKTNSTMKVGPNGLFPARRGSTELKILPPTPSSPEGSPREAQEHSTDEDGREREDDPAPDQTQAMTKSETEGPGQQMDAGP